MFATAPFISGFILPSCLGERVAHERERGEAGGGVVKRSAETHTDAHSASWLCTLVDVRCGDINNNMTCTTETSQIRSISACALVTAVHEK